MDRVETKKLLANVFEGIAHYLNDYLYMPDIETHLRVLIAAVIANRISGDPVWLLLMDHPSSGKTELLNLLYSQSNIHFVSAITANTLASGYKGDVSLLTTLDPEPVPIIVTKDFNTIATLPLDKRNEILSQLREVYDGKFNKRFGNGVQVNWEGKLGFLGACTPSIEMYLSVWGILGERFIIYRLNSDVDQVKAGLKAIQVSGTEQHFKDQARGLLETFLSKISLDREIKFSESINKKIASLAAFVAKSRPPVIRHGYTRDIEFVSSESSPRLAKSLVQLGKGLALLRGDETLGSVDYQILTDVAFGSIPISRLKILFLLNEKRAALNFASIQASGLFNISETGLRRIIEDLCALELLKAHGKGISLTYQLSRSVINLVENFTWDEAEQKDNPLESIENQLLGTQSLYIPLNSENIGKEAKND